ncbi:hypothetical protein DENSPDRAFT_842471, partial [Dentipellis sp. KUC8613]
SCKMVLDHYPDSIEDFFDQPEPISRPTPEAFNVDVDNSLIDQELWRSCYNLPIPPVLDDYRQAFCDGPLSMTTSSYSSYGEARTSYEPSLDYSSAYAHNSSEANLPAEFAQIATIWDQFSGDWRAQNDLGREASPQSSPLFPHMPTPQSQYSDISTMSMDPQLAFDVPPMEAPQDLSAPAQVSQVTDPDSRKVYVCHVCAAAFDRSHNCKVHVLTHTGEKPYPCPDCGKGFTRKHDMKRHRELQRRGGGCTGSSKRTVIGNRKVVNPRRRRGRTGGSRTFGGTDVD